MPYILHDHGNPYNSDSFEWSITIHKNEASIWISGHNKLCYSVYQVSNTKQNRSKWGFYNSPSITTSLYTCICMYTCMCYKSSYFLANLLASTISLMPRVLFSGTSPSFTSSRVTVGFSVTLEKTFSIHGFWNRTWGYKWVPYTHVCDCLSEYTVDQDNHVTEFTENTIKIVLTFL